MTKEAIKVARDCAAIAEFLRLQIIARPALGRMTPASVCRQIILSIEREWPEAFLEPEPPKLRRVGRGE